MIVAGWVKRQELIYKKFPATMVKKYFCRSYLSSTTDCSRLNTRLSGPVTRRFTTGSVYFAVEKKLE